jgi:hypothetical protein
MRYIISSNSSFLKKNSAIKEASHYKNASRVRPGEGAKANQTNCKSLILPDPIISIRHQQHEFIFNKKKSNILKQHLIYLTYTTTTLHEKQGIYWIQDVIDPNSM